LTYEKLRISNEEIWNALSDAIVIYVWGGGGFTVTPGKKAPVFVPHFPYLSVWHCR
jgi:hypothetical protein